MPVGMAAVRLTTGSGRSQPRLLAAPGYPMVSTSQSESNNSMGWSKNQVSTQRSSGGTGGSHDQRHRSAHRRQYKLTPGVVGASEHGSQVGKRDPRSNLSFGAQLGRSSISPHRCSFRTMLVERVLFANYAGRAPTGAVIADSVRLRPSVAMASSVKCYGCRCLGRRRGGVPVRKPGTCHGSFGLDRCFCSKELRPEMGVRALKVGRSAR